MTPRPAIARVTGGFTLIEVLLAVAVFAVILVAMHGVFYGALRLHRKTTQSLEQGLPLQQALAILKRDLANIVLPGGTLFGELQTTASTTGNQTNQTSQTSQLSSALNSASLKGLVVSPTLYTSVGIPDDTAPWAEVERVLYYLATPTNNTPGKDLYRSVTRNLLPVIEDQPVDQWMLGGVQDVFFTFYDGSQWLDTWDSTLQPTKLPQGIKVQIQLLPEESAMKLPEPITLVVPLLIQPGSNQVAQTSSQTP